MKEEILNEMAQRHVPAITERAFESLKKGKESIIKKIADKYLERMRKEGHEDSTISISLFKTFPNKITLKVAGKERTIEDEEIVDKLKKAIRSQLKVKKTVVSNSQEDKAESVTTKTALPSLTKKQAETIKENDSLEKIANNEMTQELRGVAIVFAQEMARVGKREDKIKFYGKKVKIDDKMVVDEELADLIRGAVTVIASRLKDSELTRGKKTTYTVESRYPDNEFYNKKRERLALLEDRALARKYKKLKNLKMELTKDELKNYYLTQEEMKQRNLIDERGVIRVDALN